MFLSHHLHAKETLLETLRFCSWNCACSVNRRVRTGGILERSLCAQPEHWRSCACGKKWWYFYVNQLQLHWLTWQNFTVSKTPLRKRDFSGVVFWLFGGSCLATSIHPKIAILKKTWLLPPSGNGTYISTDFQWISKGQSRLSFVYEGFIIVINESDIDDNNFISSPLVCMTIPPWYDPNFVYTLKNMIFRIPLFSLYTCMLQMNM